MVPPEQGCCSTGTIYHSISRGKRREGGREIVGGGGGGWGHLRRVLGKTGTRKMWGQAVGSRHGLACSRSRSEEATARSLAGASLWQP